MTGAERGRGRQCMDPTLCPFSRSLTTPRFGAESNRSDLPFPILSRGRRMALVRHVVPVLFSSLVWVAQLGAQDSTGPGTGKVVDATTQPALPDVEVASDRSPPRLPA